MKLRDISPYRVAAAMSMLLHYTTAQSSGLVQKYCSSQNTGSGQAGVFDTYQSDGACKTTCQGYSFAIVQGSYCWCSNYVPGRQVDVARCSDTCPGYPTDLCGNVGAGLFGYIYLDKTPAGTQGGQPSTTSTTAPPAQPDTVVQTVTQGEGATTVVSYVTLPPTSIIAYQPLRATTSSSSSSSTSTTSTATTDSSTDPSSSITVALTAQIVTLSGSVVTQTVTATPFVTTGQNAATNLQVHEKDGLSGGAIAGVVIGAIAGTALILLAAFFLWRRRSEHKDEPATGSEKLPPRRNTSVLSRAGLMTRGGASHVDNTEPNPFDEPAGMASQRHSMLFGAAAEVSPSSPLGTTHSGENRRHSNPKVYDQRLNPSALFANHDNGSRVSMQDGADYSRTLGVTNPDPRASWESRA